MVSKHWKYIVVALLVLVVCVSAFNAQSGQASISVTPSTVVPNQTMTVQGNNFSCTGQIRAGNGSSITYNGNGNGTMGSKLGPGGGVLSTGCNTWSSGLVVPIIIETLSGGEVALEITDSNGTSAATTLTIPYRTISISPTSSGLGSTVSVEGSGFPAANSSTGADTAPTVTMTYEYGSSSKDVATYTPDGNGNIGGTFTVPLDATIGSTNVLKSSFNFGNFQVVTDSVSHSIPSASISASANIYTDGTTINVTGSGFKAFRTVSSLTINGVNAIPDISPASDGDGALNAILSDFAISSPGTHTISVTIDGATATNTFTASNYNSSQPAPGFQNSSVSICTGSTSGLTCMCMGGRWTHCTEATSGSSVYLIPTPTPAPIPTPTPVYVYVYPPTPTPMPAYVATDDMRVETKVKEPLGGNLIRIFNFSNRTKTWSFYDPDPDLAGINTLQTVASGEVYWIKVYADAVVTLNNKPRQLYSGWNLVAY